MLLNETAQFELAHRLRHQSVEIGEVFTFLSGLYFRGKLTYAKAFARAPEGSHAIYVITSSEGLLPAHTSVDISRLKALSRVPVDSGDRRYSAPLRQSAQALRSSLIDPFEVVLLGSIASGKYVDILLECFGERLRFPVEFVGRGDMSRGGLLLRAVSSHTELDYRPIGTTEQRRGKRPPKLEPILRPAS